MKMDVKELMAKERIFLERHKFVTIIKEKVN
jgi:hypothetical protein